MTEEDRNFPLSPDSGVPGLIDQYRQQRKAWLAQADELVRLRDEVRSAAEREAMDIVTAARRDVRQIVVEARRELMVLTAQLHAAMDAVEQSSAATAMPLPSEGDDPVGTEAVGARSSLGVTREMVLGARREVRGVLEEARAEIEALALEAPVPFPSEERSDDAPDPPRISRIFPEESEDESGIFDVPDPQRSVAPNFSSAPNFNSVGTSFDSIATKFDSVASSFSSVGSSQSQTSISPSIEDTGIFGEPEPRLSAFDDSGSKSPFMSRVLSSAETQSAPRARSAMTFVALFAVVGVAVTTGTIWWMFSGSKRTAREPEPAPAAVTAPPSESAVAPIQSSTQPTTKTASPSLIIEARRASWIRASIDGQADAGRLYRAGETREIVGARSVEIRAGDAGAVFVSVNGAAARPLGTDGAVMTRRYAVESTSAPTTPPASAADKNLGGARTPPLTAPTSPVTLAVENSGRSTAARADLRAPAVAQRTPAAPPAANPTPSTSAAKEAAPTDAPSARPDLVVAGQQWLDAYQRRDRQAMSTAGTDNITVTDERATTERFPAWQNGVQRELDQVELALTGDTALLTARMTERAEGGPTSPHVSRVSQIWVRRAGQWRLADVRIMAESRLNQIVR